MKTLLALLLAVPTVAFAEDARRPPTIGWIGAESVPGDAPRTLAQVIPPVAGAPASLAGQTTIVYMNKNGATLVPGNNDARTNRSSIPGQTSQIPPFEGSAAEWNAIMACVRNGFAAFDIQVTDVDPGNVPHFESLMGGRAQQVGMEQGVLGVSPFTTDCSLIPNAIVYTFTQSTRDAYGNVPDLAETMCEIALQEIVHAFGGDHEYLAADPMSYLNYNGLRTFQNVDARCGEYSARNCGLPQTGSTCGARQNSVTLLRTRIGVGDTVAPSVAITSPAAGAQVAPSFTVESTATDDQAVVAVELHIDGTLAQTLTAPPFRFQVAGAATGAHTLKVKARDARNASEATVQVTVSNGPGPQPDPDPDPDPQPDPDPGEPDPERPDTITGGCSAGGASSAGLVLALALGGLFIRRRRR